MKYFSLFSGIGGFELGIEKGWECLERDVRDSLSPKRNMSNLMCERKREHRAERTYCIGFSEIDKYAIQIYKKHFNHKEYGDARTIKARELPDFDLLVAGFPCQSFSIAGKRGGFKDTRGTLFFEIARIARAKRPELLLLENVKGLLSHDKGKTFGTILETLSELGYVCEWQILNSKNFGVPQNRERVFIIGYLRGTSRPKVFPIGGANKEVNEEQLQKRLPCQEKPDTTNIEKPSRRSDERYWNIRRLTPTECERLQSFPDGWTEGISDTQRYKCLGNAVTVNVIEAIMERML